MAEQANFRQRLDAVLRTLDVKQVRRFLIAEKQWDANQPADPEFAMWAMIAGSANLRDLHEQARQWLVSHGHEAEAEALMGWEKQSGSQSRKKPVSGNRRASGKPLPDGSHKQSGAKHKGHM